MDPITPAGGAGAARIGQTHADTRLKDAAQKLEAAFLSEMLKAAGLDKVAAGFGGGPGEEQFRSFLVDEQASAMVAAGGVGLAESLFHALKERQND